MKNQINQVYITKIILKTMMRFKEKLAIIGSCFLFLNCASIPKIESKDLHKLTKTNITIINGLYSNFSENSGRQQNQSISQKLMPSKLSDTASRVKIEVLDEKSIRFSFFKNQTEINSKIIHYKLENKGTLRLHNKNFRLHGIPWLFGDYEIRKYQIALSNSGNLIINGVEKREGAHLIILWSPSIHYTFSNKYKKINP